MKFAVGICLSLGLFSNLSYADHFATRYIDKEEAKQVLDVLHDAGILGTVDQNSLKISTKVEMLQCKTEFLRINQSLCFAVLSRNTTTHFNWEQSQVIGDLLLKMHAVTEENIKKFPREAISQAVDMECTESIGGSYCTFDVLVRDSQTVSLTTEEENTMRDIFSMIEIPSAGSIYGRSKSLTIQKIKGPNSLPKLVFYFSGHKMEWDRDINQILEIFSRLGVPQRPENIYISEIVVRYESIMCQPSQWTVSY